MKKIKVCILLLLTIILSGCSGVYNVTINEDLTVTEDVVLSVEKQEETYDKIVELIKEYDVNEEDFSIEDKDNIVQVKFVKKFMSVEDYIINSKLYPELFGEIKYSNSDRKITINAESVFDLNNEARDNVVNSFNVELLNINFNTPLRVESINAEEENDNTYTWTIKNGDTHKSINIVIGTSAVSSLYKPIIVIALILLIVIGFAVYALNNYRKARKI
ncbi:MAG: hypothetical protein IKF36_01520 [Bacilli bacterium]|nr:hypothetical protein [Bacilli bacterium]